MKQLLIGWLAAQGIALANDASEQSVFEAFLKQHGAVATATTALGNEKSTLSGRVTALENEKSTLATQLDAEKKRASEAVTALANEQVAVKKLTTAMIEARVDVAIGKGQVAVADRATEVTTLENSKALDADLVALEKRPVKFAVTATVAGERKTGADQSKSAHEQVLGLANSDARYKDIKDFGQAMAMILRDNPALAEQLRGK